MLLTTIWLLTAISAQEPEPARVTLAMPAIRPLGPALAAIEALPESPAFAACETGFRAEYLAWMSEIARIAREGGVAPAAPDASWYPRFRALADGGDLRARLWCLERIEWCGLPEEHQLAYWRGEAYGLATALRDLPDFAPQLRSSARAGWSVAGEAEFDAWLGYYCAASSVDEVRRGAIATRAQLARFSSDPGIAARAQEWADLLIERWPDSPEAQRILGSRFAEERLQVGMLAPDFAGKDVDGREIRLSSYRGRVVVLDFWGFW